MYLSDLNDVIMDIIYDLKFTAPLPKLISLLPKYPLISIMPNIFIMLTTTPSAGKAVCHPFKEGE
jgi:hypothetical protein